MPGCVRSSSLVGSSPYPAFFAQRSTPLTTSQDSGDVTITYDQVTINLAGGFDGSSGIFTAPIQGFYHFSFSASYCRISAHIVKNQMEKISLALVLNTTVSNTTTLNPLCSYPAHAQATLLLQVGDQVSVQLHNSESFLHASDVQPIKNTLSFTGFLLYSTNKVIGLYITFMPRGQ